MYRKGAIKVKTVNLADSEHMDAELHKRIERNNAAV